MPGQDVEGILIIFRVNGRPLPDAFVGIFKKDKLAVSFSEVKRPFRFAGGSVVSGERPVSAGAAVYQRPAEN